MQQAILTETKKETLWLTAVMTFLGFISCFSENIFLESTIIAFSVLIFFRKQTLLFPLATYFFIWMLEKQFSFFQSNVVYCILPWLGTIFISKLTHVPFPTFPIGKWKNLSTWHWIRLGGIILLSSVALVFWYQRYYWYDSSTLINYLRSLNPYLLFGGIVPLFAIFNAAFEEWLYRGVIFQTLLSTLKKVWLAILIQGIWFGAAHFLYGFPNGMVGFVMASFYGIVLGLIAWETKGILASFLMHVFADITIAILLLY